jgi:DNA-binding PadR family transcriptional regulator
MLLLTYGVKTELIVRCFMSIKHAILGLLSWKSSTGYELKKIFEDSSIMYWSGNNNQIYKALLQLKDENFVTNEIQYQESSPSKKIYTITSGGVSELKNWVVSSPNVPEFKKMFLVQLAWADMLNNEELHELLTKYEDEVKMQLILEEEKKKRRINLPDRTNREILLWDMISENLLSSYINELKWIQMVRKDLF